MNKFNFAAYIAAHREYTKFEQLALYLPITLEEILVITGEKQHDRISK